MKILQNNCVRVPISQNQLIKSYPKYETSNDVFVKSQNSPSFGHNFGEILSNPKKSEQIIQGLIAIGGLALAGELVKESSATDNTNAESENKPNFLENLQNLFGAKNDEKNEERIHVLEEENKGLKKIILDLQKQVGEIANMLKNQKTDTTDSDTVENEPQTDKVKIVFPKKHGRFTKKQEYLKNIVENILFEKEVEPKVNEICAELISKKNEKGLNKEELTENFANELNAAKDDDSKIKLIVDDYYKKCSLESENNKEETTDATTTEATTPTASSTAETQSNGDSKKANTVVPIGINLVDQTDSTGVEDKQTVSYSYRIPPRINHDVKENLSFMLNQFEKKYTKDTEEKTEEPIKWSYRRPVSKRVFERDVIREIEHCKSKSARSRYYNITPDDASIIADIINSEKRFQEFFGFHGAMRFIERFIDFDSTVDVETQASHTMDVLTETIQYALKKGVTMEKYDEFHRDEEGKVSEVCIGTNIIIPENYFSEEAVKIFGTYPLKIGISENQPGRYNKYNKKALISTIYPVGI